MLASTKDFDLKRKTQKLITVGLTSMISDALNYDV